MFFKMRPETNQDDEPVNLPVTAEQLDAFMAKIIKDYALPDTNDTRDSICTLIMHMPPSVSKAPLSYFASSVNKSRANKAAYDKLQEYAKLRKEAALRQGEEAAKAEKTKAEAGNPPSITVDGMTGIGVTVQ